MTDEGQKGPYLLVQFPELGVRPDTYVWCKGMDRWTKAADVEEVFQFYARRREENRFIHNPHIPDTVDIPIPYQHVDTTQSAAPSQHLSEQIKEQQWPDVNADTPDYSSKPANLLPLAILSILFFPPTGCVATYMAHLTNKTWKESATGFSCPEESERLRIEVHDLSRSTKMWIGISFSLSCFLIAFIIQM